MKTKQQLLSELFLTCIDLNDDNFTVFFDYYGNIELVDVRVCILGYSNNPNMVHVLDLKVADLLDTDKFEYAIDKLHKLKVESTAERERLASDAEYKKKKRKEELLKELEELEK